MGKVIFDSLWPPLFGGTEWHALDELQRNGYRLAAQKAVAILQLREPVKPRRARGHSKSTA